MKGYDELRLLLHVENVNGASETEKRAAPAVASAGDEQVFTDHGRRVALARRRLHARGGGTGPRQTVRLEDTHVHHVRVAVESADQQGRRLFTHTQTLVTHTLSTHTHNTHDTHTQHTHMTHTHTHTHITLFFFIAAFDFDFVRYVFFSPFTRSVSEPLANHRRL